MASQISSRSWYQLASIHDTTIVPEFTAQIHFAGGWGSAAIIILEVCVIQSISNFAIASKVAQDVCIFLAEYHFRARQQVSTRPTSLHHYRSIY